MTIITFFNEASIWVLSGIGIGTGFVSVAGVYFYYRRKKRILDAKEKISEDRGIKVSKKDSDKITKRLKAELEKALKQRDKEYLDQYEGNAFIRLKDFNPIKTKRKKLNIKYLKDWWRNKRHPDKISLINMELINGFHKLFMVKVIDDGFLFNKKQYVVDTDCKYYNIDAKMWAYDYHESFCLPIKRNLPIKDVKDTMKSVNLDQIEYATNPSTLEKFISSEIAKQVLKSAQLDDWMRKMMTMILFTLIISAGTAIYILYSTGAFSNIQNII